MPTSLWKHLHIRGENVVKREKSEADKETPPHTWRKFWIGACVVSFFGNTSTYVEKILRQGQEKPRAEKHLHIRGENFRITV